MNNVLIINILDHSTFSLQLPMIPREKETIRLENTNTLLLVHGITYDLTDNSHIAIVYIEPINETYWKNDI